MFNTKKDLNSAREGGILSSILETAQVVVVSLVIVFLVRNYLIQPFLVKGASMEPTFQDGNYLIIDEISYRVHPPQRDEVIVFKYPRDPKQYFIKRIVGLPNEKVEIKDQRITVYNDKNPDGLGLDESYLPSGDETKGDETIQLKSNEYFVMGDNRPFSSDSRYWGPVTSDLIVGRVWLRAWPINEAKAF
jgi:signal peptidase I